jgi:hypothetical protein
MDDWLIFSQSIQRAMWIPIVEQQRNFVLWLVSAASFRQTQILILSPHIVFELLWWAVCRSKHVEQLRNIGIVLWVVFWVYPRYLIFVCRRFGTICFIFKGWIWSVEMTGNGDRYLYRDRGVMAIEVICLPHTKPNAIWKLEAQFLNFLQGDNTGLFLVRYCRKTGILWRANWNNVKKLKYYAIFIINPCSSTFWLCRSNSYIHRYFVTLPTETYILNTTIPK